ncbi:MAG: LemA family protein [Longimonas sp.]|uniref:LemA family protein n=1 Tax=Longimonas sp. TaxID=2039626 RepID=UPI003977168F
MKRVIFTGLAGLGLVVTVGVGVWLNYISFDRIYALRQIERVPQITIDGIVPGEVNLTGQVTDNGLFLTAPRSEQSVVYYRYVVEEEEEDSDGDTYWRTVRDETRYADTFWIEDETGRVQVRPTDDVDYQLTRDYRTESGSRRYTEYRIEPGDEVFLFGYASRSGSNYNIGFEADGSYRPILSDWSAFRARAGLAEGSALFLLGGLAALAVAVLLGLWLFRVHDSATYLIGLSTVMIVALIVQGLLMMNQDLSDTAQRAERTLQQTTEVADYLLDEHGMSWNGDWAELGSLDDAPYRTLPDSTKAKLNTLRINLSRSVERSRAHLNHGPESVLAWSAGLDAPAPIPLPDTLAQEAQQHEATFEPTRLVRWRAFLFLLVAGFVGYIASRGGMSTIKVKRLIEHLPTTPIDGLVYGLSEIKGTALPHKSTGLLTAPVSEEPCIYYYHAIKEKDDDDDWHTIHEESRCVPFRCRDDSGSILVDLQRAEFHTDTTTVRSSGSRKHIERRIEPGDSLYVLGPATIDTDTHNRLLITDTETDTEDDFSSIVSNWSEKKLMFHKAFNAFIRLAVGVVATVGIGLAIAGMVTSFGPALYVTTTGFALTYMMIGLGIMYYNDLVFLERRVDRNWSNIDVALAKRFDLITQLVEVVQGYLDHEAEVMDTISEARTLHEEDTPADPSDARLNAEERVRDVVTATIEDTPALHGHNAAAELMNTLDEVETEVALMRDGYNAIVEHYNARCRRLPEVLIARLVGFSPASYYTAEPNSSSAPDVG